MTAHCAAIWPIARTKHPRYRHWFDECEAAEFGHTMSDARSLCGETFDPLAMWYQGEIAARSVTDEECPKCRVRLNELEEKDDETPILRR